MQVVQPNANISRDSLNVPTLNISLEAVLSACELHYP